MKQQPLVELKNISLLYSGVPALDSISLRISQGEHTALLGPNGSGKSTLLKVIRAESFPARTENSAILWHPEGKPDASPLAGRGLSSLVSIAQTELYLRSRWKISGLELVISGLYDSPILYGQAEEADKEKALALADKLGLMKFMGSGIDSLSRVQLLRLLFARACVSEPKLLLLDECLDNLDGRHRKQLTGFLEIIAQNTTLVAATHRADDLPVCLRRGVFMDKGRITRIEPLTQPQSVAYAPSAPGKKSGPGKKGEKPVFLLENASVFLGGAPILREINWKVMPGEHWTVMGPAGSGKSTLLRLLAGDLYPTLGGRIERRLPGRKEPLAAVAEIRRHISLVSGDMQAGYEYNVTGERFVLGGLEGGLMLFNEPTEEERAEALAWMAKLDAAHFAERPLRTLSTGQTRRLVLARALVAAPRVLLLDDPFAGLDPESRARVIGLLRRMCATENIQTIMITRYPEDALVDSGRTAVLREGRLEVFGS